MEPLVDALAAGNTAIVKPSAYAPATARVVQEILDTCFPKEYVAVVTGGREENKKLLEQKFDMVFFTGSQAVGKEVLRRCAEHLTPAVLELGGKSPCIVDETAQIPLAAKRIVFGKFLNCGQTCVAPDYILCHSSIKDQLVQQLHRQITAQLGSDPLKNPHYGKIINRKHFDRLLTLGENPVCNPETLQIAPTVLENAGWDSPAMAEEIFGPILPVLTYEDFDQMLGLLKQQPKPLALYLFSRNKAHIRSVTEGLCYGGGCINDVIIHLATSRMGFGGVGESGMGAYHGKRGFDAFSHEKALVDKKLWLDLPIRYQPYNNGLYRKLVRLFLR
jgi:aldehyde dehydrogenase (NAD+)